MEDTNFNDIFADMPELLDETEDSSTAETNTDENQDETEEAETDAADAESTETTEEGGNKTEEIQPFLSIKVDGADKPLTKDEAYEYAQMGSNYKRLEKKYQDAVNNPLLKNLDEQARLSGVTPEVYLQRMNEMQGRLVVSQVVKELSKRYPDADPKLLSDYAKRLYSDRVTNQQLRSIQAVQQTDQNQKQQSINELNQEMDALKKEYPDVDVEHLPDDVYNRIVGGETAISAYRAYENAQLREQLKAKQTNEKNRSKATGDVTANAGGNESFDDSFMKGFMAQLK